LNQNLKNKRNGNKCQINCYGVSDDDGQITIEATGDVKKKIKNNEMLENLRILMLNDAENIIIPNLLVASNEVSVNHNATISSVDPNYLMALESKGLSKEEASKLLVNGFIKHNLKVDEEMIDLINY
jgi:Fe-S cluster assembly scaffold protein SufB